MDSKSAIKDIKSQISRIDDLSQQHNKSTDHVSWFIDTENILSEIFGKESDFNGFFTSIDWNPSGTYPIDHYNFDEQLAQIKHKAYLSGLEKAKGILESAINQINRKGIQKIETVKIENAKSEKYDKTKIFLAFVRDPQTKIIVENFIRKLDLNPIILEDQGSPGQTVIEKLEEHSKVEFAIVLLTPDDIGYLNKKQNSSKPSVEHRARQNVILELGYFYGKLGRNKVVTLVKDNVNALGETAGIVTIPFDDGDKWQNKTIKDLKKAGINIDLDRLNI